MVRIDIVKVLKIFDALQSRYASILPLKDMLLPSTETAYEDGNQWMMY